MSLKTALLIEGNAAGAQKAVRETKTALDDMAGSTGKVAVAGKAAGAQVGKTAKATEALGKSNTLAAGQVGNLTAQFNDIGMMLMAGQNPLQLAIQQGTQITQVIGPMGATGAVRALGTAFMGMINPVSVVTIGSIAAGAAMIQWLTSASEKAVSFDKLLDQLSQSVADYVEVAQRAGASNEDLGASFGSASQWARDLARNIAEIERANAIDGLAAAAEGLTEAFGGLSRTKTVIQSVGGWMKEIDATVFKLRDEFDLTTQQAAQLTGALEQISLAATPEDAVRSAEQFSDVLLAIFGTAELIPQALRDAALSANQLALAGGKIIAQDEAAERFAQNKLASLEREASIRQIIAVYGADSIQVKEAEFALEQDALRAKLESLGVSQDLTDSVIAAQQASYDAESATARWAVQMSGVRAEVDAILSSLSSLGGSVIANAAKQAELQALQAGKSVREAANIAREMQRESQFDARAQGANWLERMVIDFERGVARYGDALDQQLDHEREVARLRDRMSGTTGTGGGGGASSTAAIDRIIEREIERLAILRETDPVQKELLRNSRYLADATDGERAALEALIATRIAEEEQLDILQQKRDFFADTTYDALSGLILQGNSLRDVMANVAMAIADAALQAALLGKGPFAGGGGGGGLLGFVGDLLFPKLAGGGLIYGPGDGRSDDVPILASSGEFMMNAVATKRYRHVLEAMNSGGALPGFAQGGMIGGSASPRPSMPGAGVQAIEMNVNVSGANGNREIEQMVYQGVERALTQYDREILPIRIRQIESNGRRVG